MFMVVPVEGLVTAQHAPQLGEFQTTSNTPPMKGNEGMSPNVGKREARPFSPLEHATPLREPALLSNVVSNVARRGVGVGVAGFGGEYGIVSGG